MEIKYNIIVAAYEASSSTAKTTAIESTSQFDQSLRNPFRVNSLQNNNFGTCAKFFYLWTIVTKEATIFHIYVSGYVNMIN